MGNYFAKITSGFLIFFLAILSFSLVLYFYFPANGFVVIALFFFFASLSFLFYLKVVFAQIKKFLENQVGGITEFVEKRKPCVIEDPVFENLYNAIILKSQELRQIINDFAETNDIVKNRVNDIIYAFGELIEDYGEFNKKFREMMDSISSIAGSGVELNIEEKLQSFISLSVEINSFKEQLLDLVDRVKEIVNDYIERTSEDLNNANLVMKNFVSFNENLIGQLDKVLLFFSNIGAYNGNVVEEIEKMEKHRTFFKEKIYLFRDNFDKEKDFLDELTGINRTINDIFYQLKTYMVEVENLNKKTSLMSLNAVIYASEVSKGDKKFVVISKELKRLVEEIEKKFTSIDTFFNSIMEKNSEASKLISDFENLTVQHRIELSKMASELDHLSHHISSVKSINSKMIEPLEENTFLVNNIKEEVVNHSSAIKQVLVVFRDYLSKLEKAERDKESFDSLVASTSSLLDYINSTLPSLITYITDVLKNLENFSRELEEANNVISKFNSDTSVKRFASILEELQFKRLSTLENSIVLLEKARNIKKIL